MPSADTVTLACGCVIVATADGASLTPACQPHMGDPQALALAASQDPVVQALAAAVGNGQGGADGFTYSGNPNQSTLDRVRFTLQDTNPKLPLFTDGELGALLFDSGDDWLTASILAMDSLIARFAGAVDESVGSVSIAYSQRAAGYRALADTLRARLAKRGVPYAGGISWQDKRMQAMDANRVQPQFTVTQFQRPALPGDSRYMGPYSGGGNSFYLRWGTGCLFPG